MQREVLRKMTVKKTDTMSKKITPVSFSNNSSKNNINILTHTQDGKPLQRDITKDFVANYKYHAAFLFFKSAGRVGQFIYQHLKWLKEMDRFRFGITNKFYSISGKVCKEWEISRQAKSVALLKLDQSKLVDLQRKVGTSTKARLKKDD